MKDSMLGRPYTSLYVKKVSGQTNPGPQVRWQKHCATAPLLYCFNFQVTISITLASKMSMILASTRPTKMSSNNLVSRFLGMFLLEIMITMETSLVRLNILSTPISGNSQVCGTQKLSHLKVWIFYIYIHFFVWLHGVDGQANFIIAFTITL